jgi:hypothetical protein
VAAILIKIICYQYGMDNAGDPKKQGQDQVQYERANSAGSKHRYRRT